MKQALDELERYAPQHGNPDDMSEAITALRTAIEAAKKQEPRHIVQSNGRHSHLLTHMMNSRNTPPAAQRQPLTDEAIWRQYQALWPFHPAEEPRLAADMVTFARAIEAAHGNKGKNT